jgi:hypothetical protein
MAATAAAAAADAPAGDASAAAATAADLITAGISKDHAAVAIGLNQSNSAGIEGVRLYQGLGLDWSLSVLDATVPCSSTAGFNCQAKLRVQPMAAAAAAAAGPVGGDTTRGVLSMLGLDPAAAAPAAFEVRCDTAAGAGLAVARLMVEEATGQLLVVADSGELHLLLTLTNGWLCVAAAGVEQPYQVPHVYCMVKSTAQAENCATLTVVPPGASCCSIIWSFQASCVSLCSQVQLWARYKLRTAQRCTCCRKSRRVLFFI